MDDIEARERLASARVGHLATVTADGRPHVVVCCFALDGDHIVTAVDAKPKSTSSLRRLDHIRAHPATSLLVDHYDDADWSRLWWVRVDGRARVVSTGAERKRAVAPLVAKYPQYRATPPPGPAIVVEHLTWRTWSATA
jgi:PPOX class probable F420-dependent enzyme